MLGHLTNIQEQDRSSTGDLRSVNMHNHSRDKFQASAVISLNENSRMLANKKYKSPNKMHNPLEIDPFAIDGLACNIESWDQLQEIKSIV